MSDPIIDINFTLQDHWRVYKERVYPGGMVPEQNRQLHMAFIAGALVMYTQMTEIASQLPEPLAMTLLDRIRKELEDFALDRLRKELEDFAREQAQEAQNEIHP